MKKLGASSYTVIYLKRVRKQDLLKLSPPVRVAVLDAIETKLRIAPDLFGKPLRKKLKGLYRLRVGDYRIIYEIERDKKLITIFGVRHRKKIYD